MPEKDSVTAGTRTGIFLVFFALGFCSVIVQTTLIREALVVFSGNELCLGVIFGVWLFWIGVGAGIGSWLSRRMDPFWPFVILVVAGALCPALQIYGLRIVRELFTVMPGAYVSFGQMALASLLFLAPFSFMVGITFPLGCKVYAGQQSEDALGIGWLYVTEALGFLVGGLVFTFYLVEHYRAFLNATLVGMLLLAGCFSLSVRSLRGAAQLVTAGILGALILAMFWSMPRLSHLDKVSMEKRWLSLVGTTARHKLKGGQAEPRLTLTRHVESKYQHLALGEEPGQVSVFGDGSLLFSFPQEYEFPQQANLILSEHPNPRRVLILGNSTHGLLKEFLRNPLEAVWQVDLDPKVTELIRDVLPPADAAALKDPRVHFAYTDGRFFVKTTAERFDVIYINLPAPSTAMLNRYYTREFFEETAAMLNPGGVIALHVPSAANYMGDIVGREGGSIYRTVASVFKHQVVSGGEMAYLFASMSDGVVTMDPDILGQRFSARKVEVPNFSPEQFPITIDLTRVGFANEALSSRKDVPINTDLRPVTYYYSLRRWDAAAGSKLQPVFDQVGRFNLGLLGAILGGLLLMRLAFLSASERLRRVGESVLAILVCASLLAIIYWMLYLAGYRIAAGAASLAVLVMCGRWILGALRRERADASGAQFNYLTVITVCGFSAMAFELILVFAFQNLYGFLYYQIGLIIALFMVGLAFGGFVSNVLLRKDRIGLKTLIGIEVAVVGYALVLPLLLVAFSGEFIALLPLELSQTVFMSLILIAGILGGFIFPLVTALYFKKAPNTGATAGKVDSADHVGACLGALLAGTVFVPIIGIAASSIFVAFMNVGCVVLLAVQMRRT